MKNTTTSPQHEKHTAPHASRQNASSIPLRFRLFMLFYGALWRILQPVLKRHRRLKHGFEQRLVPDNWAVTPPPRATKTLWLQAASGGEALVAESILSALGHITAQQAMLRSVPNDDAQHTHKHHETSIVHELPSTSGSSAHTAKTQPTRSTEAQSTYITAPQPRDISGAHLAHIQRIGAKDEHANTQANNDLYIHNDSPSSKSTKNKDSHNTNAHNKSHDRQQNNTPCIEVICTTCTLQGLEVLNKVKLENPYSHIRITPTYFPLDMPHLMQKALDTILPDAIVLLETELWPALLFSAREKGIPLVVANGRMTEKSASAYRFLRGFLARFSPQWVLATTKENAQRFSHVFPYALVEEAPNVKFDIAKKLLEKKGLADIPNPHAIAGDTTNKPTVLLASVREEEEELLLQTVISLVGKEDAHTSPIVVVAPRHLHRAKAWMDMLTQQGIAAMFRSAFSPSQKTNTVQVIIWDAFGELSALYAYCDTVFVGGSFAPLGGQNFLEPMAFGKIPFVGPYLDNFLWIGESVMQEKLAIRLSTPEKLAPALLQAAKEHSTTKQKAIQEHFSSWLLPRTGGSMTIAKKILESIAIR